MIELIYILNIFMGVILTVKYLSLAYYTRKSYNMDKANNRFLYKMCLILGWMFLWTMTFGFMWALHRHLLFGSGNWAVGMLIFIGVLPYFIIHMED